MIKKILLCGRLKDGWNSFPAIYFLAFWRREKLIK